jgi:6-phosphogluconolactonase
MSVDIQVVEDPARACAAMLVGPSVAGGDVVLTGGSTPREAYGELAQAIKALELDTRNTTFWFGDERCVAPDDERSNYGMVRTAMLEPLADAAPGDVRRIRGELGPGEAADDYERSLREAGPPRFDLLMLGIGPDGHTASMFPGQESVSERSRLVVGVQEAGLAPYVPRVTMTFTCLALAEHVLVLAAGSSKAQAVAAAFGPDATPTAHVPSSIIPSVCERVTVLLDPAAAGRL